MYIIASMQILIVEDEVRLANNIARWLKSENFSVDIANDGEVAIQKCLNEYDVIVLDMMLPKKNGVEVLSYLRTSGKKTPVIILSAKWELDDKVLWLQKWADDYLTKPFAFDELLARIHALIRRSTGSNTTLSLDSLTLDYTTKVVKRCGETIVLSSTEYRLLEYMLHHPEHVLSESRLLEHVWDRNYGGFSNVVSVYIRYLRNKIDKPFPNEKPLIHTVRWLGYSISNSKLW